MLIFQKSYPVLVVCFMTVITLKMREARVAFILPGYIYYLRYIPVANPIYTGSQLSLSPRRFRGCAAAIGSHRMRDCALCSWVSARSRSRQMNPASFCSMAELGGQCLHARCSICNKRQSAECIALLVSASAGGCDSNGHLHYFRGADAAADAYVVGHISTLLALLRDKGQRAAAASVAEMQLQALVEVAGPTCVVTHGCPLCSRVERPQLHYNLSAREPILLLDHAIVKSTRALLDSGIDSMSTVRVRVLLYQQVCLPFC